MSSESYEVQSVVASSPNTPPIIQKSEGSPKFQHFPELPIEIQNQIWQLALPEPRIVELRRNWKTVTQGPARFKNIYAIGDPIPLLYACHNSRSIALRTYHPAFSSQLTIPAYFDETRDTILVDDLYDLNEILCTNGLPLPGYCIRYLAIDPTSPLNVNPGVSITNPRSRAVYDIPNHGVDFLSHAIRTYRSLSELVILYPVENDDEIPVWFENGVVDLLEELLVRLEFDLKDMPQIICLPYQAGEGSAGRRKAVRDWMDSKPLVDVPLVRE